MSHDHCFRNVTLIILPTWLGPRANYESLVYYGGQYWVSTLIIINLSINVPRDIWCKCAY